MDCQFDKVTIPCLSCVAEEYQTQEMTQEVRLNDGMPDIGRVIASWGQVIMRSKEWLTGAAKISGGIMVTILYAPEDGSEVRSVETWLPFQIQWNIPETDMDGSLCVMPGLRFVDSRMSGARKILVRAGVYGHLDAFSSSEQIIYSPNHISEDVQIQQKDCIGRIPKEVGEKTFLVDDEVRIPVSDENPVKVLHYSLCPVILDSRVMTDKIVFRGNAILHILYKGENGKLHSQSFEIPFSQFAELSGRYSADAKVRVMPVVTSAELEGNDPQLLHLKCSLVAQYILDELETINVTADAYSTRGGLNVHMETISRDLVLNDVQETFSPELSMHGIDGTVVEVVSVLEYPMLRNTEKGRVMEHSGVFKVLFYDKDDLLQSATGNWNEIRELPEDLDGMYSVIDTPQGEVQITSAREENVLSMQVKSDLRISGKREIPLVSGYEKTETETGIDQKPSLVICKLGGESLWDVAKRYKSTIAEIERANKFGEGNEVVPDSFLLIPIPQ